MLWANFASLVNQLVSRKLRCDIWTDGSFLTSKTEPDDVDFVVNFPVHVIERLNVADMPFYDQLAKSEFRYTHFCHSFVIFSAPVVHASYKISEQLDKQWKGDFGRSLVKKEPKGIAVVEVRP